MAGIRILLVDHEQLMVDALRRILDSHREFSLVVTARDRSDTLRQMKAHRPHLVVLALHNPGGSDCIDTARIIKHRHPDTRMVVLTSNRESFYMRQAILAGARAYLTKEISESEFRAALLRVHREGAAFSPQVASQLLDMISEYRSTDGTLLSSLTRREKEVLILIKDGHTTDDTARALCITPKTVRNMLSRIYAKLGTSNRVQTVLFVKGISG